jgi:hypothetical protein
LDLFAMATIGQCCGTDAPLNLTQIKWLVAGRDYFIPMTTNRWALATQSIRHA